VKKIHTPIDIEVNFDRLELDNLNIDMNYFEEENIKIKATNVSNSERMKSQSEYIKDKITPFEETFTFKINIKNQNINMISNNILLQDLVKKKSPWFHYNTRLLILYNNKLEYYEPKNKIKKGEIALNKNCTALVKDDFIFELFTPKRTYLFKLESSNSKEWSEKINYAIELIKKMLKMYFCQHIF